MILVRYLLAAFLLICGSSAWASCAGTSAGRSGVALLVGNAEYDGLNWPRLDNAVNDIDHVCEALADADFEIMDVRDADAATLREIVSKFAARAEKSQTAIVYFAGHGFEYAGRNFMVPVDAPLFVSRSEVDQHFIPLDIIANAAAKAQKFSVFFMDACRTAEPVVRLEDESDAEGGIASLGLLDVSQGAVFYSTAKGRPALDAAPPGSPVSPFADAIARKLAVPGLELSDFFKLVSRDVYAKTRELELGPQQPFHYGSWFDDFYLRSPVALNDASSSRAESDGVKSSGAAEPSADQSALLAGIKTDLGAYNLEVVDEPIIVAEILEKYHPNEVLFAAKNGNWRARYLLGYMYHFGIGVSRNFEKAQFWLAKAAESGEPACALELAYFYQLNQPARHDEAIRLYELAVAKGFAKAESHYGHVLWNGTLGTVDRERALNLFEAASNSGHPYASFALATYGEKLELATDRLRRLADAGNVEGNNWLCELYYQRNSAALVAKDCLTAARGGYAGARVIVALMHASGKGLGQSNEEARFWGQLALSQPELATRPDLLAIAQRFAVGD